jgi:hypothetical protein
MCFQINLLDITTTTTTTKVHATNPFFHNLPGYDYDDPQIPNL